MPTTTSVKLNGESKQHQQLIVVVKHQHNLILTCQYERFEV